jgi:hypothetical protein
LTVSVTVRGRRTTGSLACCAVLTAPVKGTALDASRPANVVADRSGSFTASTKSKRPDRKL